MEVMGTGEGLAWDGSWYLQLGTNAKTVCVWVGGVTPLFLFTFPASVEITKEGSGRAGALGLIETLPLFGQTLYLSTAWSLIFPSFTHTQTIRVFLSLH